MKKCDNCGRVLPLEEFAPRRKSKSSPTVACRDCRAKNAAYIAAHPERNRAKVREWVQRSPENRQRMLDRAKAWREANPERALQNHQKWRKRNRGLYQQYSRNHKAKIKGATGQVSAGQIEARVAMFGWRCWMCGAPWEEIDHVIALRKGGPHCAANIRPACNKCNNKKQDDDWHHFLPLPP